MAERHAFSPWSLLTGLLALAVAGLFLLGELTPVSLDGRVVAAAVLVLLGAAGLAAGLRHLRREP